MTYTPGISFLGQSTTQIGRLKQLNTTLNDLQRQLTTQKKFDNISGFGAGSYSVQKLRSDNAQLKTFTTNIATVTTRVQIMASSLQQASDSGRMMTDAVSTFYKYGANDLDTIKLVAQQQLDLMRDVSNVQIDGRYLFAGNATDAEPMSNFNQLQLNMQNLVSDWQSGALTTAQFTAAFDAMSDTDLGFNPALSSAGSVTTQIDKNLNLDYTSKATDNGMKDIMRALALASSLQPVNPGGPGPTQQELDEVIKHILGTLETGTTKTDRNQAQLGVHIATIDMVESQHLQDSAMFDKMLIDKENADTTEVVAKLQALQTQLTASYEVTTLTSKLSLINFI